MAAQAQIPPQAPTQMPLQMPPQIQPQTTRLLFLPIVVRQASCSVMEDDLSVTEAAMANMSISTSLRHVSPQPRSYLLGLPFEIRALIYKALFQGADLVIDGINSGALTNNYHPQILRTSKQIRKEAYQYLPQALTLKIAVPQLYNINCKLSDHFLNNIQDFTLFDMALGPDMILPPLPALKRLEVQTMEWRVPREWLIYRHQQGGTTVTDQVAHPLMLKAALFLVQERGIRGFDFVVQFRFWATYLQRPGHQRMKAEKEMFVNMTTKTIVSATAVTNRPVYA